MRHRHRLQFVAFLLANLVPLPLFATTIHLDTTTLGQVRKNSNLQREVPVNEYLGLGIDVPDARFSGESNMRFFRDFSRKINDYDLYQTVLHFKPVDVLQIDFGRQFVNEGFGVLVADAVKLKIMPPGYIDVTLYSGIPRNVETGDFNRNDGLRTGLSLGLKGVPRTTANVRAAWKRNNIRRTDWRQMDTVLVGADASHQFAVKTTPMIYGIFEYDTAARVVDTGTAGLDIYPAKFLALTLEFNVYNVNRSTTLPTVLGLFTRSRSYQGRLTSTWTLVPRYLKLLQTYAYQRLGVQGGLSPNGHLARVGFEVDVDQVGLHIEPSYVYSRSWGGVDQGASFLIHEQFTDELYADVGFDFNTYTKITNNNGKAYSLVLWSGYEVVRGLTLSGGFEYNRNAILKKDIRGSFKVSYVFDHST